MKVGITGHQDLGSSATVEWVRATLDRLIEEYRVTEGFSCLAAGADQLYAELLASKGILCTPVLPCRNYAAAFRDEGARQRFHELLSAAPKIVWLDFDHPNPIAFFEASAEIVYRSEVLFAVWDGQEARGFGGTADVVAYALLRRKPVIHLNPVTRQIRTINSGHDDLANQRFTPPHTEAPRGAGFTCTGCGRRFAMSVEPVDELVAAFEMKITILREATHSPPLLHCADKTNEQPGGG